MPGETAGVYIGDLTAGTEVSSTYEGRHLTLLETELIHPTHAADGWVNKGDPVLICDAGDITTYGKIVGVAFTSATADADYIAIDTEGIFNLTVFGTDDIDNSAVRIGDDIYIHDGSTAGVGATGTGDGTLSKRRNIATQRHFGVALGRVPGGGSGVIAVKVHMDPLDDEGVLFGDAATQETGEQGRSAFSSYINLDVDAAKVVGIYSRVDWASDADGPHEQGSLTGVQGDVGVPAGDVLGGAGTTYLIGVDASARLDGEIDTQGTGYICAMRASLSGSPTFTDVNILTALWVQNNIQVDMTGWTHPSSLIRLANDGLVGSQLSCIFNISVPETDYFFWISPGTAGAWWIPNGTDCTASAATDPVGSLRCVDANGNDMFIRCWAAA